VPARARPSRPEALATAAANLAVDAVSLEVLEALREAGIDPVLLKGPALARRLYDDPAERFYVDCDLLVASGDAARAEAVLAERGFVPALAESMVPEWQRHGREWRRKTDGAAVDLHRSLPGTDAPPEHVWAGLLPHTRPLALGRQEVAVLDEPATALLAALHAAQHGSAVSKPLRDLELAIERLPPDCWPEAVALARTFGAEGRMTSGLVLLPAGREVVRRLGLREERSAIDALHTGSAPGGALALERLARTRGPAARLRLVARAVVPPPDHLRYFHPLARRGRAGLVAVYLARPAHLAGRLPGAWRAWRRARRR
jgi:hypothetical protein